MDWLAGFAGFVVCGASLALQQWSSPTMEYVGEYAMLAAPAFVFPAITWWRMHRSSSRVLTFVAVNAFLVAAYACLARLASLPFEPMLVPLLIGLTASVVVSSPRVNRLSAVAIAIVACMVAAGSAPRVWSAMLTSTAISPAPDVELRSLDGKPIRLAQLRGKVLVLNFWGVWCGPCVRELPELEAFAQRPASRGSAVLAINSGIGGEDAQQISAFLAARRIQVPVFLDAGRSAYHAFNVHGLPTTIIVDSQGMVRARRVGFAATAHYEDWLAREVRSLNY